MIDIGKIKPDIERICRGLPVKRVGLFGSAVREDFSEGSDVDVLVMFDLAESADLFNSYFDLKEQLEAVFRSVVVHVVYKRFKKPVLRESID
ncbi:MAG: nucleotidyltransferase domain-containing protein [Sedimentisphaerales bacterium]